MNKRTAKEPVVLEPGEEVRQIIMEATQQVEDQLNLEDQGWLNLSSTSADIITAAARVANIRTSRLYYLKDPLGRQSIRLWTDYTFGDGMTWHTEEEPTKKVLEAFWDSRSNASVLSARGQRKSCDKLLVDGEVFFALFLGPEKEVKIRRIDPLEITEIITSEDDIEDVRFYRREWSDSQGTPHTAIYRDWTNIKNEAAKSQAGATVQKTDEALIYHLTYNTIGQRGNPLLLPALDWIRQYRRFLASRIAIMLALARWAWKTKVTGGQTAVDAIKAKTHEQEIKAGSQLLENLGADTQPIKQDSGARNAYEDGRQIKLMIFAAVGLSEQYYADISTGNLATAKTVELPMMKMFKSYQKVWADTYQDIDSIVLDYNNIPLDKQYVDRDFPAIAPEDAAGMAASLLSVLQALPELAYSKDVQQVALMSLGIDDTDKVLEDLSKEEKVNREAALVKALKQFRESLKVKE